MPAGRVSHAKSPFANYVNSRGSTGLALVDIRSSSSCSQVLAGLLIVRILFHSVRIFPFYNPLRSELWFQGLDLVLPQVQQELDPVRIEFATLALHVGLIIGASVWGVLADIIGRRVSFNVCDVPSDFI